jgi:hypothetical protein
MDRHCLADGQAAVDVGAGALNFAVAFGLTALFRAQTNCISKKSS